MTDRRHRSAADWIPLLVILVAISGQWFFVLDKLLAIERKISRVETLVEVHLKEPGRGISRYGPAPKLSSWGAVGAENKQKTHEQWIDRLEKASREAAEGTDRKIFGSKREGGSS